MVEALGVDGTVLGIVTSEELGFMGNHTTDASKEVKPSVASAIDNVAKRRITGNTRID